MDDLCPRPAVEDDYAWTAAQRDGHERVRITDSEKLRTQGAQPPLYHVGRREIVW